MTEEIRPRSDSGRGALAFAIVLGVGAASCSGSTFSAGSPTDGAPSEDASNQHETGTIDSTSGQSDAAEPDEGAVLADAAVDGARPADAASEVRSADASATYRGAVLADGPVAYWRMGISSGSIVPDESGHHNDLVLQGSGHAFGVAGAIKDDADRAMGFDGVSSYAIALRPRDLDFPASAPFSIECWARRERIADGGSGDYFQQIVSAVAGGPPNRNGYLLYLLPGDTDPAVARAAFEYDAPNQDQIAVEGSLAPLSTYAHYVATFDGMKVSLYIDGTLASSKMVSSSIATRMTEFVVGRESSTGRYHFAGAIDEVAVYDRPLSTLQVIAHRDLALRR